MKKYRYRKNINDFRVLIFIFKTIFEMKYFEDCKTAGLIAVSYTHLDVYKRQAIISENGVR